MEQKGNEMTNLKTAQSTAGYSNRSRELMDNYPTPDIAVSELLKRESFDGIVWEPACGSGHIAKFFDNCMASDIRKSNIYGEGGVDFIYETRKVDCIITNPPYRYAQKFVEQALFCADKKVAMLLKLAFLESVSRYALFQESPLKTVYVFSKRLPWIREGINTMEGKNSMLAFAWFVWEHGYEGKPSIEWILVDKKT